MPLSKRAVIVTAIITFVIALALIYVAFGKENFALSLIFILLGVGSIGAAIKYTVGNNAYGYSGFGDVFVFIFFGLVSVNAIGILSATFVMWVINLLLPALIGTIFIFSLKFFRK